MSHRKSFQKIMQSDLGEAIVPLYWALVRPHLESALGPSPQAGHGRPGACPEKAARLGRGLENKSDEERLRELGLFSLEKRRLRGDLLALYSSLPGGGSEGGLVSSPK